MDGVTRLAEIVDRITRGWDERIEFAIVIQSHTPECKAHALTLSIQRLRHYECQCPEHKEQRAERRRQLPLITQLVEAGYSVPCNGENSGGSGSTNRPGSKIPGNLVRPDELLYRLESVASDFCNEWGSVWPGRTETALRALVVLASDREHGEIGDLIHELRRIQHQARVLLGYETEMITFADMVCGNCGGALRAARDASSSVRCAGRAESMPCGTEYPWWTWLGLLEDKRLVDTEAACLSAGIPRGTLYRWAHEGRIARHGGRGKGQALWDLGDIQRAGHRLLTKGGPMTEDEIGG